jgi:hypothetical protein
MKLREHECRSLFDRLATDLLDTMFASPSCVGVAAGHAGRSTSSTYRPESVTYRGACTCRYLPVCHAAGILAQQLHHELKSFGAHVPLGIASVIRPPHTHPKSQRQCDRRTRETPPGQIHSESRQTAGP